MIKWLKLLKQWVGNHHNENKYGTKKQKKEENRTSADKRKEKERLKKKKLRKRIATKGNIFQRKINQY